MAGEVQCTHTTARTLYALIRNSIGQVWDTVDVAFETYATAQLENYDVALSEQGTASGYYTGTFPTDITTAGVYSVVVYDRAGGSPAETDTLVATGDLHWTGSVVAEYANVERWNGTLVPTEHTAGYPIVTVKDGAGTGEINTTSGRVDADITHVAAAAVSTTTAQLGVNVVSAGGTAWGSGAITAASIATDAITAAKIAADAIGASELAADAVTEIQSGLATAAALATVQADTDDIQARLPAALVGGRIDASVGAVATDAITAAAIAADAIGSSELAASAVSEIAAAILTTPANLLATDASGRVTVGSMAAGSIVAATFGAGAIDAAAIATGAIDADALAADAVDEIWAKAMTELAAVPGVTGTVLQALQWLFLLARNKVTQTAAVQTLRNDADNASIGTAATSDDSATFTRNEWL